jgi:aminomethyltransferase
MESTITTPAQRTHLFEVHKALGAKIIPFGGYEMPVNYPKGILQEHFAVRRGVGLFDVSHMGEVEVHGADALAFVQHLTVNDASTLTPGKAQYSAMCYTDGGIVDDLLVYHCDEYYMLVINAANIAKDWAWMLETADRLAFNDLTLTNVSDEMSLLAVQGPKSVETLQSLTDTPLADISYYHFANGILKTESGSIPMILSRTGYTGELGFELYFKGDAATATSVWNAVMQAGTPFGIEPCGLGARDTLRLEKGYCLYGNDIDQTTHPLEAGLGWITKLRKTEEFAGKAAMLHAKSQGLTRNLVGFRLQQEKVIPRAHYALFADSADSSTPIGEVTSGTIAPMLNVGVGLGYVDAAHSAVGTVIYAEVRGKRFAADVVKLPFV